MDSTSDAAWAVLQAAHKLQHGNREASIDAGAVRAAALTILGGSAAVHEFQVEGGTYAGIEAQVWELNDAGLLDIDTGMAMATAPGQPAHVVDDDYGLRVTDAGRAALTARPIT